MKIRYTVIDAVFIILLLYIFFYNFEAIENTIDAINYPRPDGVKLALSGFQLYIVVLDYFSFSSIAILILSIIFIPIYKKYLTTNFIYSIGKNNEYRKIKSRSKKKIAVSSCAIMTGILLFYIAISTVYSILYDRFNEENLSIINRFDIPNLFYTYIITIIVTYLYVYTVLTLSENISSNIKLILVFSLTYLLVDLTSYRLLDGRFTALSFSHIVGVETSPFYLLISLIFPIIIYIASTRESKDISVR